MLKAQYIGKLGDLEKRAKAEYISLKKAGKAVSSKQSFVSAYVSEAAGLESQCDAQVDVILSSLQKELVRQGGDISLIKAIKKAYEEEKILKKSYYINTYR